jgi:cyanate permease
VIELPLAHLGHWYHSLLYLAPVIVVAVALWILERRERGRDEDD